jgi:hypothetical protein
MKRSPGARTARFYPVLFATAAALLVMLAAVATAAATPPADARTGSASGYTAQPFGGDDILGATPTPTSCTGDYNYTYTLSTGAIVSGTQLVAGSQCGSCVVDIELPFPFTFYGQTYTSTKLSTQGNIQFETEHLPGPGAGNECPLPEPLLGHAIIPHWSAWQGTGYHFPCLQYIGSECGIYTSTTGTAPNRIFNIHWRLQFISTSQHTANFEARLFESTNEIQFIYGWVSYGGANAAVGVQDGSDLFTEYSCNTSGGIPPGRIVTWHPPACWATPGPSHTPTNTPTLTRTPTLTPTPTCSPLDWSTVRSPNPSLDPTDLLGVAAVSADNVWAVGTTGYAQSEQTVIQRWDGSEWTPVTSPNPGTASNSLAAVDVVSANDIWAVGTYTDSVDMRARTLTMHWDGTQWSVVPSPNTANPNWLVSVEAISSNDVWAVGYAWTGTLYRTVTLHWIAGVWSIVPSPSGPNSASSVLMDVSATGPNDVWAVGSFQQQLTAHTFTLRWQGTQWTVVPSPDATVAHNYLYSVKAFSANDAWAVGWAVNYGNMISVALRWNGTTWTVVPGSHIGRDSWFFSVDGESSQDMWAVGWWKPTFDSTRRALFQHWDGTQWHFAPAAEQGPGDNRLSASAQVSGTDGWAVGSYEDGSTNLRTLTMRLAPQPCGTITAVPTPTFTQTPAPTGSATGIPAATNTPAPTLTPTATPTACTVEFTDVPEGHTFYPYVRCLACRGIVQGYADGTFRPDNHVTRGQVSKIVSLSAGFAEVVPPTQQSFEDVPYGSPFWEYVERIYTRGIIVGYPCGGAGEPCVPPKNKPYFRPNAGATRGQLVKIVAESAGFSDPIPETQYTFADVPPGHTFWIYIERLVLNRPTAIQGYPCGGPGEPCDSENRPYLRPNNPVTRGQTSKIVSNTFFPECTPP